MRRSASLIERSRKTKRLLLKAVLMNSMLLKAKVCKEYKLTAADIMRHYDATGVNCPVYYVENGAAWSKFKEDVMSLVEAGK